MKYNKLMLFIFSIFLVVIIFYWGDYLIKNNYITECFTSMSSDNSSYANSQTYKNVELTNHNVDQPINTTYSCQNMCGPLSRCSLTGDQCTSDIDCPGCQPSKKFQKKHKTKDVIGENDAGKLLSSTMPDYSTLTNDIGTKAKLYTSDYLSPPPKYFQGVDEWKNMFDQQSLMFRDRYEARDTPGLLKYEDRWSLSGEFIETGPLASNGYL